MSDQHADTVAWAVAQIWWAKDSQDELKAALDQGWEPFQVVPAGPHGYVYHLKRSVRIDGGDV